MALQFDKYSNDFSIVENLNCEEVQQSYISYKEPLCNDIRNGFIELLALRVISLPLEIGLCILGIRFVLRNKVDVPKYVKAKEVKEDKKKAKKKKGSGDKNEDLKGEEDDDEEERPDDDAGEEEDPDNQLDAKGKFRLSSRMRRNLFAVTGKD